MDKHAQWHDVDLIDFGHEEDFGNVFVQHGEGAGVGAQGAGPSELRAVFGDARRAVLASSSRGVLRAGPDVASLRAAALEAAGDAARALRS